MRMKQSSKSWVNCQMKIPLDFLRLVFPGEDFLLQITLCVIIACLCMGMELNFNNR